MYFFKIISTAIGRVETIRFPVPSILRMRIIQNDNDNDDNSNANNVNAEDDNVVRSNDRRRRFVRLSKC